MRRAFVRTLVRLAEGDERVLLLTGDLGFMALEPFSERFPGRFFNVGVAEQNMVGLATGLSEAGFVPFVYSIATFATLRTYEFIRNGPVLNHLPVRIVGIGDGFDYGTLGPTHQALEDVGVLRVQPSMTVVVPADHLQACSAFLATRNVPGPVYFRLSKDEKTVIPGLEGRFRLGRTETVRDGGDLLMIALGSKANEAVCAAESLSHQGIEARVIVVAAVSPAPFEDLYGHLADFPVALTVESHYSVGGIASLASEIVAQNGLTCRVVPIAVATGPDGRSGSPGYLHRRHGLTSGDLVQAASRVLSDAGSPQNSAAPATSARR